MVSRERLKSVVDLESGQRYVNILKNEVPNFIPIEELQEINEQLLIAPFTLALREVRDVPEGRGLVLSGSKARRVESLLGKGSDMKKQRRHLTTCEEEDLPYRVRVEKPKLRGIYAHSRDFVRRIGMVRTCDLIENSYKHSYARALGKWMLDDISVGGCLVYLGEQKTGSAPQANYKPRVFSRLYVAVTQRGEHVMFLDAIEGGDVACISVHDWIEEQRGLELLYAVSSAVYLTRAYGLEALALGECEAAKLGMMIGLRESLLFETKSKPCYRGEKDFAGERKIGFPTSGSKGEYGSKGFVVYKGPYAWMLHKDNRRRVLRPDEIEPFSVDFLVETLDRAQVVADASRAGSSKGQELRLLHDAIWGLNSTPMYRSRDVSIRLKTLETSLQ